MRLHKSELFAIGAALAAVAILAWTQMAPRHSRSPPGASALSSRAGLPAISEGRWQAANMGDAAASDARAVLAAAIDQSIVDNGNVLTAATRRALTETIARELVARSARSGEEYVNAVEDAPGVRWLLPQDAEWLGVDTWFEFETGGVPDRSDPRAALLAIADAQLAKEKNRITRYGVGDRGLFVAAFRVRSEDQINDRLAEHVSKDFDYWFNAPATGAKRLRVPTRSIEQVLQEENQAIVGASLIAVEVQSGWTYAWYCYWYWESRSASWQCYEMIKKGPVRGVVFY